MRVVNLLCGIRESMRVLLICPYRPWDIGRFCADALRKMGHSVKVFDYRKESDIVQRLIYHTDKTLPRYSVPFLRTLESRVANLKLKRDVVSFEPDVVITIKGETVLPETIEWIKQNLGIPTILWFPDDPTGFDGVSKNIAPDYNFVFTNSVDCVPRYKEIGVDKVEYIPFACDPTVHKRVSLKEEKRKYENDLCFVGSWTPEREKMLELLTNFKMQIWGGGWSKRLAPTSSLRRLCTFKPIYLYEMVKLYNATKIGLNNHSRIMKYGGVMKYEGMNLRSFEITGCGSFLLSDKVGGMEDAFKIGREIVCYQNEEELVELVEYYLNNPEERMKIAKRGQERAYRDHTYEKRMMRILSVV